MWMCGTQQVSCSLAKEKEKVKPDENEALKVDKSHSQTEVHEEDNIQDNYIETEVPWQIVKFKKQIRQATNPGELRICKEGQKIQKLLEQV